MCNYKEVELKSLQLGDAVERTDDVAVVRLLKDGADPNYIATFSPSLFALLCHPVTADFLALLLQGGLNPNLGLLRDGLTVNHIFDGDPKRYELAKVLLGWGAIDYQPKPLGIPEIRESQENPSVAVEPYFQYAVATGKAAFDLATEFSKRRNEYGAFEKGPPWNFHRFGTSTTILPDDTCVFVAGEHEDYYDPDFCIFNDIVVAERGGPLRVYLYPQCRFRPTDFHTATRVDDHLILIGNLGYKSQRREQCQLYRVSLNDFSIEELSATGRDPGWISHHKAALDEERQRIVVWDIGYRSGQQLNSGEVYSLCCESFTWHLHGSIYPSE